MARRQSGSGLNFRVLSANAGGRYTISPDDVIVFPNGTRITLTPNGAEALKGEAAATQVVLEIIYPKAHSPYCGRYTKAPPAKKGLTERDIRVTPNKILEFTEVVTFRLVGEAAVWLRFTGRRWNEVEETDTRIANLFPKVVAGEARPKPNRPNARFIQPPHWARRRGVAGTASHRPFHPRPARPRRKK